MNRAQIDTLRRAVAATLLAILGASAAQGQDAPGLTAMVEAPCAGVTERSLGAELRPMLEPGARFTPPTRSPEQAAEAARLATERRARDWPNLCRYRSANAAQKQTRIVFMGDSITEGWPVAEPEFFQGDVAGRGISGQTSPQMLLRFRQDVIALRPAFVHILAGTNDLAGNTGPTTEDDFKGNIQSMAELAKLHGIRVLLGSIPPAASFSWAPQHRPAAEIRRLNSWMRDYAERNGFTYVDYHSELATPDGAFRPELSNDGVHPNVAGYAAMQRILLTALGDR